MVVPLSEAGHQRVTHPSATLTPRRIQGIPFDLHALSTPLAFILSQDQTLRKREFNSVLHTELLFEINLPQARYGFYHYSAVKVPTESLF